MSDYDNSVSNQPPYEQPTPPPVEKNPFASQGGAPNFNPNATSGNSQSPLPSPFALAGSGSNPATTNSGSISPTLPNGAPNAPFYFHVFPGDAPASPDPYPVPPQTLNQLPPPSPSTYNNGKYPGAYENVAPPNDTPGGWQVTVITVPGQATPQAPYGNYYTYNYMWATNPSVHGGASTTPVYCGSGPSLNANMLFQHFGVFQEHFHYTFFHMVLYPEAQQIHQQLQEQQSQQQTREAQYREDING